MLNENHPLKVNKMKKKCYGCQKEKGIHSFSKKVRGKFGRSTLCKVCKNMYDRIKRGNARAGDVLPVSKRTCQNLEKPSTVVKLDDYRPKECDEIDFKLMSEIF